MSRITDAVRAECDMLTVDQVCELLKVSKDWVYKACQANRIPHRKLGHRTLRFSAEELRAYIRGEWEPEPLPQPTAPRRGRPRKW